ncbi:MAG: hypothetical protein HY722_11060 [Planctomycetes bacterium]|nr:hypothetical protein [Planctomycetota bacterium]
MRALRGAAPLALALALAPASAQARFRGDERQDRPFSYNAEYFLNVLSYEPRPRERAAYADADSAVLAAAGSLSARDLWLDERFKVGALRGPFRFGLEQARREDFDARYARQAVHLERRLGAGPLWLRGVGEPAAEKEEADIGVGLAWRGEGTERALLEVWLPDFELASKGPAGVRTRRPPRSVRGEGLLGPPGGTRLRWEVEADLPMELEFPATARRFAMERLRWETSVERALGPADEVQAGAAGEETRKVRDVGTPSDASALRLDRDHLRLDLDWRRRLEAGRTLEAGTRVFYLYEEDRRPTDLAASAVERRRELAAWGAFGWPWGAWRWTVDLHAALVDADRVVSNRRAMDLLRSGVQAKAGLGLSRPFGEEGELSLKPSVDLDSLVFGGGHVQLRWVF